MYKNINFLVCFFILCLSLSSCVPTSKSGGRKNKKGSTSEETVDAKPEDQTPVFTSSLNYFQDGANISTTSLRIPIDFEDNLYLRGEQINYYIKNNGTSQVQCLSFYFPNSLDSKVYILKANPREFYNYSTKTREYYYFLDPSNEIDNKSFCLKTGIINQMSTFYPAQSLSFSLNKICPSCNSSLSLDSDQTKILTSSGNEIGDISISTLGLKIQNTSEVYNTNQSCTTVKECTDLGFDCCSSNLCIRDKTVKSTTDQSSTGFLQAFAHIETNPAAIYDYSQYYNLCTDAVITDEIDSSTGPSSLELAEARLSRLKELYDCTTPVEGETSICTDVHKLASLDSDHIFTIDPSDKNFTSIYQGSSTLDYKSIQEVIYGTQTLYDENNDNGLTLSGDNDDLGAAMSVTLTAETPTNSNEDVLKIKYKIDGSCEKLSAGLAKCTKYYTQGKNEGDTNDHSPSIQKFNVPSYTDITKLIKVEVDGDFKFVNSDWKLVSSNPSYIEFENESKVYDTQVVKIHYFVNLLVNANLMTKLDLALTEISEICECPDKTCRLKPSYTTVSNAQNIADYKCSYPAPDVPEAPLQTQFGLSSKTIPVRYYDEDGGLHDEPTTLTPKQEGPEFKYTSNDLLKPNNVVSHIGFNEIYGSITSTAGSAKAPKMIRVTKGKSYNIFVDSGAYSSCLNCGNDYYSRMIKLFPGTFLDKGAGFIPDPSETNPLQTKTYRSDDILFGRACFVPATMLPYTHAAKSTREIQRRDRMAAQHFLFANGMNRDWYGFDYGALIGSFDGVTWFAIGNQRRITAKTRKLFIAVNSYFGDLATQNTFSVTVSEASSIAYSGSAVNTDFDNDGAQCQKYHICQTDSDCASSLGWDYVCENIGGIKTNWPKFDANGLEIPGAEITAQLIKLIGPQISGGTNRCVYKGRGSICDINYTSQTSTSTYNYSSKPTLLSCSSNSYCQNLPTGGTGSIFNTKIARYGKSVKNQNQSSSVSETDLDLFGLGSRIIGRPYSYNGKDAISIDIHTNLTHNKVNAICLPGREVQATQVAMTPAIIPSATNSGDKVNNNGMTSSGLSASSVYYSSCSNFDTSGNYLNYNQSLFAELTSSSTITNFAGAQSLSTNALTQLESLHQTDLVRDFDNSFISEVSLEKNRCLRAPGSSCFTSLDCAPSKTISQKYIGMDPEGFVAQINKYEIKFWQEDLICSSEHKKDSEDYSLHENRCCRETGKTISIATTVNPSNPIVNTHLLPGLEVSLDERSRYSRNSTTHYERRTNPTKYPNMLISPTNACSGTSSDCKDPSFLKNQFNTLQVTAAKTCCSKNWIREFDSENGGGHTWSPLKLQTIDKKGFECLNWAPVIGAIPAELTCKDKDPLDPLECTARSISEVEAMNTLDWVQKFELLGIPQLAIESDDYSNTHCSINLNQYDQSGSGIAVDGFLVADGSAQDVTEYKDGSGKKSFSALDKTNFSGDFKRIFSADEFACCSPLGTKMDSAADANLCCSGNINPDNLQCALKNYTNLSAYFNKYVSSEAASLAESNFDEDTGYIKSPTTVEQLACQVEACSSGLIARGISWTELKIRGLISSETTVKRFLDGDGIENDYQGKASLFNDGLRWNNNVYCVPEELSGNADLLEIYDCSPTAN